MIGLGSPVFGNSVSNNNYCFDIIDGEFLTASLKNIPLLCTIVGMSTSSIFIYCLGLPKKSVFNLKMTSVYRQLFVFLTQR